MLDGYFSDEEKEKRDPLMLAGHLNLAACHLKLNNNFKCIKECEKVKCLSHFHQLVRPGYMYLQSYKKKTIDHFTKYTM